MIDIVNLKCDPVLIGSLQSEKGIFPVYHMSNVFCPIRQTEHDRAKWENRKQTERVTYVYGIAV